MGRNPFTLRGRAWRYAMVMVGLLTLVTALGGIKFLQISRLLAFGKQMEAAGPPPEAVSTSVAQSQTWEHTLRAVGTVSSVRSVEVRNEVAGTVKRIAFSSGAEVKEGDVLVELDADVERSQLVAARARREQAATALRRARELRKGGAMSQAELDNAEAALKIAQGDVLALEARVDQKIIRAPFSGRLGIREVNVGQFLNPGSRMTVIDSIGELFVDFALPQEETAAVTTGLPVRVAFTASPKTELPAQIVAVGPRVDEATRNVDLRARVSDPTGHLKPGMFMEVTVVMPQRLNVVAVPATAIVHASFGDSIFVIEEKKPGSPGMAQTPQGKKVQIARQQFVRVGSTRGDFVQVIQGLAPGAQVVTGGAFKLRNGAPVVVDNAAAPRPELQPRPENR